MILSLVDEAVGAGARLRSACHELGLSVRTIQRWREPDGGEDRRHGSEFHAARLTQHFRMRRRFTLRVEHVLICSRQPRLPFVHFSSFRRCQPLGDTRFGGEEHEREGADFVACGFNALARKTLRKSRLARFNDFVESRGEFEEKRELNVWFEFIGVVSDALCKKRFGLFEVCFRFVLFRIVAASAGPLLK